MQVSALWLYPVQSLRGQKMAALDFALNGLRMDRWFGIRDVETGGMVGSSMGKRAWLPLITWDAVIVDAGAAPKVEIRFPDGAHLLSDDADADRVLSERLGRAVELKGKDGIKADHRYRMASCHLLTSATLKRLRASYPEGDFAPERFRPNMVLDCGDAIGFIEQPWLGHLIKASSGVVLEGTEDCARCALTTRAQGDLPSDPKILHTVMLENGTNAGIYAKVSQAGRVAVGDEVKIEE
ncbi:MOSC domain-containing protein [Dongia sp. agr-C8]